MGRRPARSEREEAVEGLYTAFARYGQGHPQGCPHCVTDADHARLASRPLRSLTGEDLARYAFKALTTWGDEADLKHFLPRLLELLAGGGGGLDAPTLTGKLSYGGWRAWPAPEQEAIDRFFRALWEEALARGRPAAELLQWLAPAYPDLGPFLPALRGSPGALRGLLLDWGDRLGRHARPPVYLSEAHARQLRGLLLEPGVRAALEAELLAASGAPEREAAEALEQLEALEAQGT